MAYANFPIIATPLAHTPYELRADADPSARGTAATRTWNDYNAGGESFDRVGDPRDMVLAFKDMLDQFKVFFAQGALAFVSPLIDSFLGDFEAMLQPHADAPGSSTIGMNSDRALQIIYAAFDTIKTSGDVLTHDDLLAAAKPDSSVSPEVRQAVLYMLSEPNLLRSVDTARQDNTGILAPQDKAFVRDDFLVAMDRHQLTAGDRAALRTVKNNAEELFGANGLVSRDDLETLVESGNLPSGAAASPGLIDAARRLLDTPALLDRLDTGAAAYRGDPKLKRDGTFSEYELDLLLKAPLDVAV